MSNWLRRKVLRWLGLDVRLETLHERVVELEAKSHKHVANQRVSDDEASHVADWQAQIATLPEGSPRKAALKKRVGGLSGT